MDLASNPGVLPKIGNVGAGKVLKLPSITQRSFTLPNPIGSAQALKTKTVSLPIGPVKGPPVELEIHCRSFA